MNTTAKRNHELRWFGLLGAGFLIGALAYANVLFNGHGHAFNLTRAISWGILVSTYEFFLILSAGLVLWVSHALLGHRKEELGLGLRALLLAFSSMGAGFALMAAELNHPLRMARYVLTSPNFSSPLWWMGLFYALFAGALVLQLLVIWKQWPQLQRPAGVLGMVTSLAVLANMGAVLGLLESRAWWHGPFIPVYFALSALVVGGAALAVLAHFGKDRNILERHGFFHRAGRVLAFFVLALLFLFAVKVLAALYGQPPEKFPAMMALIAGPLAVNFWIFEILLGILAPLALLAIFPQPKVVASAGLSLLVGAFFMRYDLIVAGQLVPMRQDLGEAGHGLLHYVPSLTEISIVVGAVCLCLLLYSLAEKIFDLEGGHRH